MSEKSSSGLVISSHSLDEVRDEVELLRSQLAPLDCNAIRHDEPMIDKYDKWSIHVLATVDGVLAGGLRLYPRRFGEYRSDELMCWSELSNLTKLPQPTVKNNAIVLNRIFVFPQFRGRSDEGRSLGKRLMEEGLKIGWGIDCSIAVMPMSSMHRKMQQFADELGFVAYGPRVDLLGYEYINFYRHDSDIEHDLASD